MRRDLFPDVTSRWMEAVDEGDMVKGVMDGSRLDVDGDDSAGE